MKQRDLSHLATAQAGSWETLGTKLALQANLEGAVLLENNDIPISDIADATGFEDAAYFSKLFKKRYEISPSEYRKRKHNAGGQ